MAKLQGAYILTLTEKGDLVLREPVNEREGTIILREPTPAEWNHYSSKTVSFGKKGRNPKDQSTSARCELFDKIVQSIDNIEDDQGFIALSDIERVPARYKSKAVFLALEDEQDDEDVPKN